MGIGQKYQRVGIRIRWQLLTAALIVFSSSQARAQARDVEGARRWQAGDPAPVGYHVARKHTLGVVGGSLLAGGYGISALYGLVFLTECYVPGADGRPSDPCNPNPENRAGPLLFIPIAGPFLTFTNSAVRHDGGAVFWFSTFGAIQVAGAALLSYDLVVPHYGLKRGDSPKAALWAPRISIAPAYFDNKPGLSVVGQF